MTEIQVNTSDSDVSIGSWSLVEDDSQAEEKNSVKSSDSSVEIIDIDSESIPSPDTDKASGEEKKGTGFLTFDEFLQERLLDYDFQHAEKAQKGKKKGRRGGRKSQAPILGISAFIMIILAMTAFATLCSTLSQRGDRGDGPVALKKAKEGERELGEINDTIKELERLSLLRTLEGRRKNDTIQQCPRVLGPPPKPKVILSKILQETRKPKVVVTDSKNTQKESKFNSKNRSTWIVLKEFLLDTKFHALVSLVMTNIYLVTLLVDFTKKPNKRSTKELKRKLLESLERGRSTEECKKYLFKELPFWNTELSRKKNKNSTVQKSTSTSKFDETQPKANAVAVAAETKKIDNVQGTSCPFVVPKYSKTLISFTNEEYGKSECQRRFEELDLYQKKFENLRENQRNRVKLLKQKYKNEVSFIKDTEEEAEARAEKINKTSQKFIRKLKFNRERYLLELKKVKELRQRVADAKKRESLKEATSEVYAVALPPIYDYTEKFKMIKEKFERHNRQIP